nr:hypothetical protein [uncultured Draconibacterium sp.]
MAKANPYLPKKAEFQNSCLTKLIELGTLKVFIQSLSMSGTKTNLKIKNQH